LKVTTTSLPSGRAGEGYDSPRSTAAGGVPFTTTFVDGTTVPYRWSISNPPPGLDISYYTGEVYGRPTQEGQYYPKITVTEGAYEAGNSYWEQQQVFAINRYADQIAFQEQLLLREQQQFESSWPASGLVSYVTTTDAATQFSTQIAATGLPSDVDQQLTSLGIDTDMLAFLAKAWSSFPPNTIISDVPHAFDALTTPLQQLISAFVTTFSSLAPKAQIGSSTATFELVAPFTLGTGSDGIHPDSEDVSFSLGPFAITIPANSFRLNSKGYYQFAAVVQGVSLQAIIKPTTTGYQFQVDGSGVNLSSLVNPMATTVQVGNDGGTATVTGQIQ